MIRRSSATATVLKRPDLAEGCVRVEVECPASRTGLTQLPGLMQALTTEQMVTAATFEHEARCGRCDTEPAHAQGDRQTREQTDRAWNELLAAAGRRYAEGVRN